MGDGMDLKKMGERAQAAKYALQKADTAQKNTALRAAAKALLDENEQQAILDANEMDIKTAETNGMHPAMIDRLRLSRERIAAMAEGLVQIAELPDPVGECLDEMERPNGLHIKKISVPLGVIGIIYESRPNVTADAFGLCFKAGNAVILKGGSDAIRSNMAITACLRKALQSCEVEPDVLQLIEATDRGTTTEFMRLNQYINVLIPRGGAGLIRAVVENATVPVIETGTGNCHIYVDEDANQDMALAIIINAKTQRIGVCNACESLLIHEKIKNEFLPKLSAACKQHQVEVRADQAACELLPDAVAATEEDYGTEYLDYIVSLKIVGSTQEAINHINRYNTKHSEAIITDNKEHADQFLQEVDAACVYVNASTRYTDGFEFGFGAEIGISTQMLHARGPMGLKELTSYKYTIEGSGHIRP